MLNLNELILDGKIALEKISDTNGSYRYSIYDHEYHMEINLSSQYSFLIKRAAEFCEYFASDLLIDINSMEEKMGKIEEYEEENGQLVTWFGFREMGVDHDNFIESRGIDNKGYKAIYVIVFDKTESRDIYYHEASDYTVTLYKVNVNN